MPTPANLPPPIRTDNSNPFAHHTMRTRHPRMIAQLLDANPDYPPIIAEELRALQRDLIEDAPIVMLNLYPPPAPDYIEWASAYVDRGGNSDNRPTWQHIDWFFAETVLFRLIIEAVRWWELRRDPFAPIKQDELQKDELWELLENALDPHPGAYDHLPQLLRWATFGNRIDLSYTDAAARGAAIEADDILTDDAEIVRSHLLNATLADFPQPGRGIVHLVLDNAGTELAMDLALTDTLLTGFCDVVILHTKYHPTFVSDATNTDVIAMIGRCQYGPHGTRKREPITAMGRRLQTAFKEGRLRLAPNLFWTSPLFMWEMPRQLQHVFQDSQLVIIKGDANYRRLVGDAIWDYDIPLEDVVTYFPAPMVALRTLKSDPILGIDAAQAAQLDEVDPHWHTNGQRGVIQMVIKNQNTVSFGW